MANTTNQRMAFDLASLHAKLQAVEKGLRSKILVGALTQAAKPIESVAKQLAPTRTGALRASIITKVISNPDKGTAAALVGPDRQYYRGGEQVTGNASRRGADKPANYAHLVEFGHVAVKPIKGTRRRKGTATEARFVSSQPFLRPAIIVAAPQVEVILHQEIEAGIDRAMAGATT